MTSILQQLQRTLKVAKLRRTQEEGNSLFLIMGMLLIMLAFFGLAVDTAITVNARQETINTANNAIVTAVTQTGQNTEVLNYEQARNVFIQMYEVNRQNAPISCATATNAARFGGILAGPVNCPFILVEFNTYNAAETAAMTGGRFSRPSAIAEIYECSPNFFLTMISDETCFPVTTTGRLSNVRG